MSCKETRRQGELSGHNKYNNGIINLIRMKQIISAPVLALLVISCSSVSKKTIDQNANHKQNNDWAEMNLKGEVKLMREIKYKTVEKDGEVQKGERKDSVIYVFNDRGNIIDANSYKPDGSLDWKYTYKYDGYGNKIERNLYKPDGSLGAKYTSTYDSNGNIVEDMSYHPDGSLRWKSIYRNDSNGNIIEENMYKPDGGLDWKYVWKYDKNGNKIETNWYKPDGSLTSKQTYKHDDNMNQVERNSYNRDGSLKAKYTYKYDCDKTLNWIKRIELENDAPVSIWEREIEYF